MKKISITFLGGRNQAVLGSGTSLFCMTLQQQLTVFPNCLQSQTWDRTQRQNTQVGAQGGQQEDKPQKQWGAWLRLALLGGLLRPPGGPKAYRRRENSTAPAAASNLRLSMDHRPEQRIKRRKREAFSTLSHLWKTHSWGRENKTIKGPEPRSDRRTLLTIYYNRWMVLSVKIR